MLFDFLHQKLFFPLGDHIAFDGKEDFLLKLGDTTALDPKTGELHFTSPWPNNQNDDPDTTL